MTVEQRSAIDGLKLAHWAPSFKCHEELNMPMTFVMRNGNDVSTLLSYAAEIGDLQVMERLLKWEFDQTAIIILAYRLCNETKPEQFEMFNLLIEKGNFDVDHIAKNVSDLVSQCNKVSRPFIEQLAVKGRPKIMEISLRHGGVGTERRQIVIDNAMLIAMAHGYFDCVGVLIKFGANCSLRIMNPASNGPSQDFEVTPLSMACENMFSVAVPEGLCTINCFVRALHLGRPSR